jgi:ABC-2 type transport system ATP-binding protein
VAAIEVEDLRRTYRSCTGVVRRATTTVEALRGISFSVERGELFGLLGPNGAGKTTTIKILTTLLLPTGGEARVLGIDPARRPKELRPRIGYVFGGDRGLYDRLSGLDNLRYFADLYRVPAVRRRQQIGELLAIVGLAGRERERVETYSRGMRQRLHIARGLLHDPEVVFLDEPTIGLDPVGARELRDLIAGLREGGKTILLTTHYMFEADALCDRIGVVARGRLVAEGTPRDLKARVAEGVVVEIEVYGIESETVESLRTIPGVTAVGVEDRDQAQVVVVQAVSGTEPTQDVLARLEGVSVGRVATREPTLEDAYVALVTEPDADVGVAAA